MLCLIILTLFFVEYWENLIYLAAGCLGIISIGIIVWFLLYFLYRMKKGSEKNQIK
jgi:hypothetical protein